MDTLIEKKSKAPERESKKHHCDLGFGSNSMLPKKGNIVYKWCRPLKKLAQVSQHHPATFEHFRSYPEVIAERQKHLYEEACFLLHPCSMLSLAWKSLMLLVNVAHMAISPFRLTYLLDAKQMSSRQFLDEVLLGLDVICILDIIIKFNVGYVDDKSRNVVMDRDKIACYYFKRWLIPDLISSLPIAYLMLKIRPHKPRCLFFTHVFPLLRTAKIKQVLRDLKTFMKIFTTSYIWHGCIRHAFLFTIMAHWCSCFVFLPSAFSLYWFGSVPLSYHIHLTPDKDFLSFSEWNRYAKAMFLSLQACFGTGMSMFRAVDPEQIIIQSIIILSTTVFMVYTLVFLLKIYLTIFNTNIRYNSLMNQVEEYMKQKQFPSYLKKRVLTFYQYRYQDLYFVENDVLDCLSEELRNEVNLHTCHKLVKKVRLFDGVPASVVGMVLGCLSPEVYLPNDPVVRAGELGDCMYFIASGTVAVYSLKGVEVCHLVDGAHFGEVALLMHDRKRVATVVAVEITQVYRLDEADFRQYVVTHRVLYERIQELAAHRMHETVLVDEAFRKEQGQEDQHSMEEEKPESAANQVEGTKDSSNTNKA